MILVKVCLLLFVGNGYHGDQVVINAVSDCALFHYIRQGYNVFFPACLSVCGMM